MLRMVKINYGIKCCIKTRLHLEIIFFYLYEDNNSTSWVIASVMWKVSVEKPVKIRLD